MAKITAKTVQHIADLAKIPLQKNEAGSLAQAFRETLEVVDKLQTLDVKGIEPSHQVTGLSNVTRPDKVNKKRMFTQKQALANAPRQHNGYFVVPRIIDK